MQTHAVAILLSLTLLMMGCRQKDENIYTNKILGLSVKKVPGWIFISEEERKSKLQTTVLKQPGLNEFVETHMSKPFLIITKPRQITPQPIITVLVAPLDFEMSTNPVKNLQEMAASGARAFYDYRIVENPHSMDIGGRKGAYCKATYTLHTRNGDQAPVSFETLHLVRDNHYFLIGVVSRQPEDESTAKEIKQIISSFKIDDVNSN